MDLGGFEPPASPTPRERSTADLKAQLIYKLLLLRGKLIKENGKGSVDEWQACLWIGG